jgi:hypothetical protein
MSDTPETDKEVNMSAWLGSGPLVHAEFARKLERERDEAVLELGAIQATIAEALNLPRTPVTAADVHAALNHLTQ